MKLLTSETKVLRYDWTKYGKIGSGYEWNSGYCLDQGTRQDLVKQWRLLGFVIWTKVLDTEEVPMYAIIDLGIFGETSWRSKFSEYIK